VDERRAHQRFPAGTPVHVRVPTRTAFAQDYIVNISRGGCFIASDADVEQNERVSVRFDIGSKVSVILDGEVTHMVPGPPRGFGVRFDDMTPERLANLDDFVAGTIGELGGRGFKEDTRELPRSLVEDLVRKSSLQSDHTHAPRRDIATAHPRHDTPIGLHEVTPMEIDVEMMAEAEATELSSGDWLAVGPDGELVHPPDGPSTAPNRSVPPEDTGGDPVSWVMMVLDAMLHRLGADNAYGVLEAGADEATPTIVARARDELALMARARAALPENEDGLADQLDALVDAVEAALEEIGAPSQRAALDLSLGHFTPGGRTPQERLSLAAAAESLRAPYVRENPVLVNRAAVFGIAAEREAAEGDVPRAVESARRAVGLDPYNLELRELLTTLEGMARTRSA
jgi:hypothetical protein